MGRALIGGALIGLGATLFWVSTGRVAGVSGLLRGVLREADGRAEGLAFLVGLVIAGGLVAAPTAVRQPIGWLFGAGLLVGFGTRLGGGCTSGRGGSPRHQPPLGSFGRRHSDLRRRRRGDRLRRRTARALGAGAMKRLAGALGAGLLFGVGLTFRSSRP